MSGNLGAGVFGTVVLDGGGLWADLTADNITVGRDHRWFVVNDDDLVDAELFFDGGRSA
jgi:hypothetical protein